MEPNEFCLMIYDGENYFVFWGERRGYNNAKPSVPGENIHLWRVWETESLAWNAYLIFWSFASSITGNPAATSKTPQRKQCSLLLKARFPFPFPFPRLMQWAQFPQQNAMVFEERINKSFVPKKYFFYF